MIRASFGSQSGVQTSVTGGTAGGAAQPGGKVVIKGGLATTTGTGGEADLTGGSTGTTGVGGAVVIAGGAGGSTSGNSGGVSINPGLATSGTTGVIGIGGDLISKGTKFTTSGCSISATTGGAWAGSFTLGANTCTAVVTLNGAVGGPAPNGWDCSAHDQTAPTILIGGNSSSTASTASFTIPAGAGATDVISFHCVGY